MGGILPDHELSFRTQTFTGVPVSISVRPFYRDCRAQGLLRHHQRDWERPIRPPILTRPFGCIWHSQSLHHWLADWKVVWSKAYVTFPKQHSLACLTLMIVLAWAVLWLGNWSLVQRVWGSTPSRPSIFKDLLLRPLHKVQLVHWHQVGICSIRGGEEGGWLLVRTSVSHVVQFCMAPIKLRTYLP